MSRIESDRSDGSNHKRRKTYHSDHTSEETNLINFSFLNHKHELNKVLNGTRTRDLLVKDPKDFWLFLGKYENLLKRSGQCILPIPVATELLGRLPSYQRSEVTELKLGQFLQIVTHYLDFKQKERFTKLKKLRKTQANLPVAQFRNEIVSAVREEQVVFIAGDTGCGKSTQIPQFLHQAGFQSIACTQPRRIACISLSKRVSHEMLCEYGTKVGFQIRFERSKSLKTKILFITEGLLLRQLSNESSLSQYDVLVLDEVHERHLHGDFLLGVAKCILKQRPELKLVLMSATINIKLFSDYFAEENARVIEVPGRLYPIKMHYMPQVQDSAGSSRQSKSNRISPEPFIQIMQLIDNKYPPTEKGDLLIFMSGLNEITSVVDAAKEYAEKSNNWIILPLHSSLSIADQDKVFDYPPDGVRKCVIATNIAETSITIDGIRFVIDSGKMKEISYDQASKMQRLKEFWISKASADQRKGRAGRTGPGVCYRLYSQKIFEEFDEFSTAEINRVPLESLLLQMISMGLPNARLFPFIEPPPADSLEQSIYSLKKHDALTQDEKLTPLGQTLSRLPVDISIGKMLLMGCVFQQLQPVLTLAAALSVQTPFTNRAFRDPECERARKDLESDHGDPITVLNSYKEWLELKNAAFNRDHVENTKTWCRRRGLEEQRFYEITKLRNQFQDLLNDCGLTEMVDTSQMSSGERAIRHGELRQLKELRRAHKMEAPKKRKLLKSDTWGLDGEDHDDKTVDIRDVEFRLSHDSSKINNLLQGSTACSYRDLMTLKLILISGLYPQIAIPDEFNYCKSPSQQFYHTEHKPFACLHPMGFFANNPAMLQLAEPDIIEKSGSYKSKLPLSSRHQLLCYLSLLETTKPYLMNTMRLPAAQTLMLFAHSIETNSTFSRIICDSWLCLDFPLHESGQTLLLKASNLRRQWNKCLATKLDAMKDNVENALDKGQKTTSNQLIERELWHNLATYMNSEIPYTIKRLLPADLKTLYDTSSIPESDLLDGVNPFANDFKCTVNSNKGGIFLTENICYGCVKETDWSIEMANEIVSTVWECPNCHRPFNITGLQRLRHTLECKPMDEQTTVDANENSSVVAGPSSGKEFVCNVCNKKMYLKSIDILKHKKTCK
ncbi:probable ATP-dependent RNA helicase DHX34 isoform X2 [Bradysia coprophila]|uniref:probable ATP-dependent RNA helicase DHX34 isoform X2 n=1 Tax=Bradysia coprophila TaxID=38358 RepID=UPI00187D7BE1|nr:probable ATP-dependent RNA helicase DHX34 isoform X2 [Bradysia coprophila]